MKIILQSDVANVGRKHDVKEVSSGFALNLLIPKGLAIPATKEALDKVNLLKKEVESEKQVHEDLLSKNIKDLADISLTIKGKANDKGHLFAGIHKEEIVKELYSQKHITLEPAHISLEHPIKELGEHTIQVIVGNKKASFKVILEAL